MDREVHSLTLSIQHFLCRLFSAIDRNSHIPTFIFSVNLISFPQTPSNLRWHSLSGKSLLLLAICRINRRRGMIALYRQGTQQQIPESPTVTPLGVRGTWIALKAHHHISQIQWNEALVQDTTHLLQRPCYQRGSLCQDPTKNRTTRRPPDHHTETQIEVVCTCLPFIRSGQSLLARHSEKGKKSRQTEKEVRRQCQEIDRRDYRK